MTQMLEVTKAHVDSTDSYVFVLFANDNDETVGDWEMSPELARCIAKGLLDAAEGVDGLRWGVDVTVSKDISEWLDGGTT